jgi:thiol-disulfide isomerase/thioredoxin
MFKKLIPVFCLFSASFLPAAPAPDFTVTDSDGKVHKLYADYVNKGKTLVIEMFFTTCPPCNTHAPGWQALYQNIRAAYPDNVEFLMLSTQNFDDNADVAAYKTTKGLSMPGVGQDGGSLTALTPYFNGTFGQFQGTPTFIVIAPFSGEVAYDIRGSSAQNTLSLLGQKIAQTAVVDCRITDFSNKPVPNVTLSINAPAFDTAIQTIDTVYNLVSIKKLQNTVFTVNPSKEDNVTNGVNAFDLVLVSRHILGIDTFRCPWQFIAADMNNTGSVSAADIVAGRKVLLGIDKNFNGGSWRFLGARNSENGQCIDFKGVKIGDLSTLECPSFRNETPEDRSGTTFWLESEDLFFETGQRIWVVLRSARPVSLSGLQMQFNFDPRALEIESVEAAGLPGFGRDFYRVENGELKMLWYGAQDLELNSERELFVFYLKAFRNGRLSKSLFLSNPENTTLEVYEAGRKAAPIELKWSGFSEKQFVELIPNPASGVFVLAKHFESPKPVLFQMFDAQGRLISEKALSAAKGLNRFSLEKPAGTTAGPYFIRLDGQSCGKIVFVP